MHMNRIQLVDGRIFVGESAEKLGITSPCLIGEVGFDPLYFKDYVKIINAVGGWKSPNAAPYSGHLTIIDCRGEVRTFKPETALEIVVKFIDFQDYDNNQRDKKIIESEEGRKYYENLYKESCDSNSELNVRLNHILKVMPIVYDFVSSSEDWKDVQKNVSEILHPFVNLCGECGKAVCVCEK